ncbi:unnamed protein product [Effrenium voratum]|uniref:Uncharacterized protein n=1 Tax=Effrenium voratum TaxID=2562239 RepID=A0AA36I6R4_9DINO|nr:unnamed protein product [Effrenium voratum]CAJ1431973.1 unnamed protein product [Effrenium voratum]
MNHIQLSFSQFMWASFWIAVPASLAMLKGLGQMRCCKLLVKLGWLRPPSAAAMRSAVFHLVLSNLGLAFQDIRTESGEEVATFEWSPFPHFVDTHRACEFRGESSTMRVSLNLSRGDLASATLDGHESSPDDTLVLLRHYTAQVHPKVHAYANWGCDPQSGKNLHLQKMSVVTACYNHFGFNNYPKIARVFLGADVGRALAQCTDVAMRSTVPPHAHMRALAPSPLIKFVGLMGRFARLFKNRTDCPESSCEAYWLGTVVHSLEHHTFGKMSVRLVCSLQPSPCYRSLCENVKLVRCTVVDDIPYPGLVQVLQGRCHRIPSTRLSRSQTHRSGARGCDANLHHQVIGLGLGCLFFFISRLFCWLRSSRHPSPC